MTKEFLLKELKKKEKKRKERAFLAMTIKGCFDGGMSVEEAAYQLGLDEMAIGLFYDLIQYDMIDFDHFESILTQ